MKKKLLLLLIGLLALCALTACAARTASAPASTDSRIFTDLVGRKVSVPAYPQRIAAMAGPTYEMLFMLGAADRIALVKSGHTTDFPLALLTNPKLKDIPGVLANPGSSVNIEDYLSRNVDLSLYYENDNELKKFDAVGIPSAVLMLHTSPLTSVDKVMAQSLDEYIKGADEPVMTLAAILGGDAVAKAQKWEQYCRDKYKLLYDRTHSLTDAQRKTVYWGNTWGEEILSTYSVTYRCYEIWLCGGKLVGPENGNGNFPEVTKEQLFTWNPDIILIDNHGGYPDLVMNNLYKENSDYRTLKAVSSKQLYRIPSGVFFLDKGSTTALMLLWFAKIVQPELFSDINIVSELKNYYHEFYGYSLTDDQAQKVLDGWYERVGEDSVD